MYIKEVNITGFRSYKELTTVRNFSSKHNVVVGRNGSGKSNFFTAIQFVLSNDFSSLNQADRHAFLHEGVGSRAPLAKVEIVFDNTDRRIPTENDEVRIMRQVGPKKDQFFIDNKQVTRTEIVNLMESAGFSRSNPYYIVKQGKITELATAADAYRLKLIKEVAGTRVFDEKKEESTKILHDTQAKIAKSVQLLGFINDRLLKLEEEKEDLKEYQKWDKMRRAIEYTIYDLEIKEAKSKYEKLTSHREKINAQQNEVETKLIQAKMSIQEVEMQIHQLETHYKGVKEERTTLLKEQSDLMERKTQLELAIRDLAEDVDRERSGRDMAEQSLRQLKRDIAEKEGQLEKLQPQFERLVEDESRLGSDIRIGEQKCRELYAKQGHQEQFKTVEERDRHLRKEIHWIERRIDETEHQIREIDEAIVEDGKEHERLQTEFQDFARILHEKSVRMDTLNAEEKQKKAELDKAMNVRMENARQEKDVRERLTMVQYEMQQSEQELRRLTSKTVLNGIASLNQVLDELRQSGSNGQNIADGYYGRVIDLFECESQYNKAIEVTAESRLFFHVVRDDRVAMKLLERINQRGLPGELNFYPLNRILVKDRRPVADADASPILDHLQYDPDFEAVFRSIFGNSVFVRDLAAGSRVAKQERFDCVTLDGDQVSRRGPMSGGYIDRKRSKIDLARKLRNFKRERAKLEEQTDVLAQNVAESMTEVERIRLEITKLTMDIQLLSKEHKIVLEKKRSISELLNQHSLNLEPKKNQKTHLGNRIRELEAHRTLVTDQLGTELQSQLSNQEREHVDQIEDDIKAKKEQMDKLMRQRMEAENRIQTLKNQLQSNLLRKRENLNAKIESITVGEKGHRLATEQSEVKMVNERLNRVLGRLQELELDLGKYDTEKEELSNTLDAHQEGSRELNEQLEECAKNAEIYCTKIANIQSKREECLRKIRDIGSLPADTALGKYDTMGLKQLDRRLTECMNELKKYENVNKKALDQFIFMRASTQKEELTKRVEELQNNERTIQELLTVLENRRYETLQLTFKQVAKNFEDVFNKLIPQGKANLVMQKVEQSSMDSSSDSQQKKPQPVHVMETFVGTSIKVSFTGVQEVREISALSGGQKTLVALALIFAIQKCDPAPFYLFDEIDAALDQEHRRAVAEMIHELSENAQFITTTFRAELLEHSEKFYGVRFRDKMSYIDEISQQQAQDFVQDDQTHS